MENYQIITKKFNTLTQKLSYANTNPIIYAIQNANIQYLLWLIENETPVPNEALEEAIGTGNLELIKIILSHITEKSSEVLSNAIISGEREIITLLLDSGFPITDIDFYTAIDSNDFGTFKLLADRSKNIDNSVYSYAEKKPKFVEYLQTLGYGPAPPSTECPHENGQIIDPITGDPIPEQYLVSIRELGIVYCFDLRTLYQNYKISSKFINPFTRAMLSPKVQNLIKQYQIANTVEFTIHIPKLGKDFINTIDRDDSLGDLLLKFNELVPADRYRGRQNLSKFNLQLHLTDKSKSIYEFDLATNLNDLNWENYVLTLQDVANVPSYKLFLGMMYPKLYNWAAKKGLEWIELFVPDTYKVEPLPLDEHQTQFFAYMKEMIKHYNNNSSLLATKTLQYIDGDDPKISSDEARELVMRVAPSPEKEAISHYIYSRVIDKFNLNPVGIEAYYQLNRYELPDYTIKYKT